MKPKFRHLSYPWEVDEFTFGDLKQIIKLASKNKLECVEEKTDGQNLLVSWRDGKIIFARNKGHLKNCGENALDIEGLAKFFEGRGVIAESFNRAAVEINNALSVLSEGEIDRLFNQGMRFMSVEVIYVKNPNIILYDQNELRIHGFQIYDEQGNPVSIMNKLDARVFVEYLMDYDAHLQTIFTIKPLQIPLMNGLQNAEEHWNNIVGIQQFYALKDPDTILEYKKMWWESLINNEVGNIALGYSELNSILIERWACGIKSPNIAQIKKKWPEFADKISKTEKKYGIFNKTTMSIFDILWMKVGVDALSSMSDLMVGNEFNATESIRARLRDAAFFASRSSNKLKKEKFAYETGRLNEIGGVDKMIPSEGITFIYRGRLLKMTGAFAPINQLLGMERYSR